MPYRRRGKIVQVKRSGRWVTLKVHKSIAAAIKHLRALHANVKHR